jgi:hypothetical protein
VSALYAGTLHVHRRLCHSLGSIHFVRPALRPTLPPNQGVAGIKRSERGADRSPPSSAEVKISFSFISTPPVPFYGVVLRWRGNFTFAKIVWKVRGLTLLLRIRTLWRCGNGLFFELPPLASDPLITTLYPRLVNVQQTVDHFEISCLGAPFSWLEKPRNRMGRDLNSVFGVETVDRWNPITTPVIQSRFCPLIFLSFSNHENGAPRQEISKWSTVYSTFSRRG